MAQHPYPIFANKLALCFLLEGDILILKLLKLSITPPPNYQLSIFNYTHWRVNLINDQSGSLAMLAPSLTPGEKQHG